jgi:serine protease Do
MNKPTNAAALLLAALLQLVCFPAPLPAADDVDAQAQAAFAAAVDRVAPAVVRIETVGGLERVGAVLFGNGPTTGLVVDPAGYIVSSAFNFVNKPASILVRLGNGVRRPARLVATDHSRMLVLLKIETEKPLPVCEIVPRGQMRVGQWAIAVGRTFDGDRPNLTVGILSALSRVWGKAIQTDAAVSPNNYGGPLVDVHGRVLGVLVPLSPQGTDEIAGFEWYDSGIGFAIPLEDIQRILPRWKKGEDLYAGRAGISLKGPNTYTGSPVIAACRPKCPAANAGLKPGDRIVAVDGRPVSRTVEVEQEIRRRYAGEPMRMAVMRGGQRIEAELKLAAKLEPFQHGFLGILPMRDAGTAGVTVRYVYPASPAATAGIAAGDVIVSLQGEPVGGRAELAVKLGSLEPGGTAALEVRRAATVRKLSVTLAQLPAEPPAGELPPARAAAAADTDHPQVGAIRLKVPEFSNEVWAYVPEAYAADVPYGVVIWLHGAGGFDWPELLARWRPLCQRHDLILVAPKAADSAGWTPGEAGLVDRLLLEVVTAYHVDPARIAVCGQQAGGTLAFAAAFGNREAIRAVAAVEAAPAARPPENDPLRRLAVYLATAHGSRAAQAADSALGAFRQERIPVTLRNLGDAPRGLSGDELAELARWIDALDRI